MCFKSAELPPKMIFLPIWSFLSEIFSLFVVKPGEAGDPKLVMFVLIDSQIGGRPIKSG